jgi:hypothetical protein
MPPTGLTAELPSIPLRKSIDAGVTYGLKYIDVLPE